MKGVLNKLKKRRPQDNSNNHNNNAGSTSSTSSTSSSSNSGSSNNSSGYGRSSPLSSNGNPNNGAGKTATSGGGGGFASSSSSSLDHGGGAGGGGVGVSGGNRVVTVNASGGKSGKGHGGATAGGNGNMGARDGQGSQGTKGGGYSPSMDGMPGQQRKDPPAMPPPPGKGAVKGANGQLPGGVVVAPSSSTNTALLRNNGVEDTPVADVALPRRPSQTISRRSASFESSRSREDTYPRQEFVKELPLLKDSSPSQRETLFQQKLKLCSVVFDMTDPMENSRDKELKRSTLLELVDHVNSPQGQQIFTPAVMPDVVAMVKANVCRALPPQPDDCDPDKDEPLLEEAWPHLQVVYEFLVRFVVSSEVDAKQAKAYVDQSLCLQLVELFDSEDPRERDYLKTILHRVYGKFMMHRAFIRRAVGNAFLRFVYENPRHNGIGELLEILGSIVNGFATPLKKEHVDFLQVCLLPLHTPAMVNIYHQQLSYCVVQYVEKEPETATHILKSLIRFWPWRSSSKQVIFLTELEEVLELVVGPEQIAEVEADLFNLLAKCISSEHFQVAERALFLWNNEQLATVGVLSPQYPNPLLPFIYGPLHKRSTKHWNATVEGLALNVLRMYNEQDPAAFERCHQRHLAEEEDKERRRLRADAQWMHLEELAQAKAGE